MSDPSIDPLLRIAEQARARGHHEAAIDALKRALSLDADHALAHALLSLSLLAKARLAAAEAEAASALRLDVELALSHYAMGAVCMAARRLDEAEEHIQHLLLFDSDEPSHHRL